MCFVVDQGVNTFQLVKGRILPVAIEQLILSCLNSDELGEASTLSKDVKGTVRNYLASASHITIAAAADQMELLHLGLLRRHCIRLCSINLDQSIFSSVETKVSSLT